MSKRTLDRTFGLNQISSKLKSSCNPVNSTTFPFPPPPSGRARKQEGEIHDTSNGRGNNSSSARYQVQNPDLNAQSTSGNSTRNSIIIAAVTEGRGMAKGEIGLAALDLRSSELFLSQFSDSSAHHSLVVKLQVLAPVEIIVPITAVERSGEMKMLLKILREEFQNAQITTIDRKFFDASRGQELLNHHKVPECSTIRIDIKEKYYCLACIAALFKYVEFIQNIVFAPASLKATYSRVEDTCMIDPSTVKNLELIMSLKASKGKKNRNLTERSLYGILNDTKTTSGGRTLRSCLLQPSTDMETIQSRLDAVEELLLKDKEFAGLRSIVDKLVDVDHFPTLCAFINKGSDTVRLMEYKIVQILNLKMALSLVSHLIESLSSLQSPLFTTYREHMLKDQRFKEIEREIEKIISPNGTGGNIGKMNKMNALDKVGQKCYAVRMGVNGLLDVTRRTFSELMSDSWELLEDLNRESNLNFRLQYTPGKGFHLKLDLAGLPAVPKVPTCCISIVRTRTQLTCSTRSLLRINDRLVRIIEEIITLSSLVVTEFLGRVREKVTCLFNLSEVIAGLDFIVSLTNYASLTHSVRPTFSLVTSVREGRHPMLEKLDEEDRPKLIVPNDVYVGPESSFIIITGPNMAGKSTYLKQVALHQVMAQAGSFVPANQASFRLCDQIFSRIGHNDDIEGDQSNFMVEMTDMKYILQHLTSKSLLIIDELGRSTAMEEGMAICHAICEELVRSQAFVFFATHYLELSRLDTLYHNVDNYHFDSMEHENGLVLSHRLKRGHYDGPIYGFDLARVSTLSESCIAEAKELAKKFRSEWEEQTSDTVDRKEQRRIYRGTQRLMKIASVVEEGKTDLATVIRYLQQAKLDFARPHYPDAPMKKEDPFSVLDTSSVMDQSLRSGPIDHTDS